MNAKSKTRLTSVGKLRGASLALELDSRAKRQSLQSSLRFFSIARKLELLVGTSAIEFGLMNIVSGFPTLSMVLNLAIKSGVMNIVTGLPDLRLASEQIRKYFRFLMPD